MKELYRLQYCLMIFFQIAINRGIVQNAGAFFKLLTFKHSHHHINFQRIICVIWRKKRKIFDPMILYLERNILEVIVLHLTFVFVEVLKIQYQTHG